MSSASARCISMAALKMRQPMGEFYVGVMTSQELCQISFVDMRRIERELDNYIGIQRILSDHRVKEIEQFVNTVDATFPTSVVLAVPEECAEYDEDSKVLKLCESPGTKDGEPAIPLHEIAKVLDGQHRIEGLREFKGQFEVPVTIFVNADIADQAYIFATVNLAQTKVNKSLVYDLLDYAKSRSPQKTCHEIAVALNRLASSPFRGMIKRLGSATPGVSGETLTQATFVMSLLPMITRDEIHDRDVLLRGKKLAPLSEEDYERTPFRALFVQEKDADIARNIVAYFSAVAERWPESWASRDKGNILPRTNGFRAFMRFLKDVYLDMRMRSRSQWTFAQDDYAEVIQKVNIPENGFNIDEFPPGSSGEKRLYDSLISQSGIHKS